MIEDNRSYGNFTQNILDRVKKFPHSQTDNQSDYQSYSQNKDFGAHINIGNLLLDHPDLNYYGNSNKQKDFGDLINKKINNFTLNDIEITGDLGFTNQIILSLIIISEFLDSGLANIFENTPKFYINGYEDYEIYVIYELKNTKFKTESLHYWGFLNNKNDDIHFNEAKTSLICLGSIYNVDEFEDKTALLIFNLFNLKPHLTYTKILTINS